MMPNIKKLKGIKYRELNEKVTLRFKSKNIMFNFVNTVFVVGSISAFKYIA